MPIDPSIPLSVQMPQSQGLLSSLAGVMQLRGMQQQIEENDLINQARARALRDDQALRMVLQTRARPGQPIDWDGVVTDLESGGFGTVAMKVRDTVYEQRQKLATTAKTEGENLQRNLTMASQIAQGISDQGSFERGQRAIAALLGPQIAKQLGEQYDPARVNEAIAWGRTASDHLTFQNKAIEHAQRAMELAQTAFRDRVTAERAAPEILSNWRVSIGTAAQAVTSAEDWAKLRSYYSGMGSVPKGEIDQLPVDFSPAAVQQAIALAITPKERADLATRNRAINAAGSPLQDRMTNAQDIAEAIVRGDQPPDLTRMYGLAGPVRAFLARAGYDLTSAQEDWNATVRHIQTLNGPQQLRLRQAVDFTYESLGLAEQLAKEWKSLGLGPFSRASLKVAAEGGMGQAAQEKATKLNALVADISSELGTVYKGGNSSTDESLKLAAENLKAEWSEKTFLANVAQIRKNLELRRNSIRTASALSASGRDNPYMRGTSGVEGVEGTGTGTGAGAVPADVRAVLSSEPPGEHELSDGSVWRKNADGSITRVR